MVKKILFPNHNVNNLNCRQQKVSIQISKNKFVQVLYSLLVPVDLPLLYQTFFSFDVLPLSSCGRSSEVKGMKEGLRNNKSEM